MRNVADSSCSLFQESNGRGRSRRRLGQVKEKEIPLTKDTVLTESHLFTSVFPVVPPCFPLYLYVTWSHWKWSYWLLYCSGWQSIAVHLFNVRQFINLLDTGFGSVHQISLWSIKLGDFAWETITSQHKACKTITVKVCLCVCVSVGTCYLKEQPAEEEDCYC